MSTGPDNTDWGAIFSAAFAAPASTVEARVWATVFGDEYPAELEPYSYTSRSELAEISTSVQVGQHDLLVDVGAGRGGPGLWVAATTGASYLAVDIAPTALAAVTERAARLGLADRARTAEGSFEDLPLADGEASAVMSIDALLFSPDKAAALREIARVLRPGGRLVFTTWDYKTQPPGRPPQVSDHRPLISAAGLNLVSYEETPDWERRHRETDRLLMEAAEDLATELGEPIEDVRRDLAEMAATVDAMSRRILVIAERPITAD
jgi:SAM-dependent methyltransferase